MDRNYTDKTDVDERISSELGDQFVKTVARMSVTRVAYAKSARYTGTRESRATAPALGPL